MPEANVRIASGRAAGLECFPSPGHASHHVCYFDGTTLFAGDAAGVRIQPSRAVLPPTPPPDVDVEAWYRTLEEIERHAPERLALIHFGVADDVSRHLTELRERLDVWAGRVKEGLSEEEFVAAAVADLPPERGSELRTRDADLAVVPGLEALLGHPPGERVGSRDAADTGAARDRGVPEAAEPGRGGDGSTRRLTAFSCHLVRLGRRTDPSEHGRVALSARSPQA